jgi:hypothetical protein
MPMGIASIQVKKIEQALKSSVLPARCINSIDTEPPVLDTPRSPFSKFDNQMTYCSAGGLFRPSLSSSALMAAAEIAGFALRLASGSIGASFNIVKLIIEIMNKSGMACMQRFRM